MRRIETFSFQPTRSFLDGLPQREEYVGGVAGDAAYTIGVRLYAEEWRERYECPGCGDPGCPQHGISRTKETSR